MPMDRSPSKKPPTYGQEARVPAMLRVRGDQIVGIEDHQGNVLGIPLTLSENSSGGVGVFAGTAELDLKEKVRRGETVFFGRTTAGITTSAGARLPQLVQAAGDGIRVVGPVNLGDGNSDWFDIMLPGIAGRLAPQSVAIDLNLNAKDSVARVVYYMASDAYAAFWTADWDRGGFTVKQGLALADAPGARTLWAGRTRFLPGGSGADFATTQITTHKIRIYAPVGVAADVTIKRNGIRYNPVDVSLNCDVFDDGYTSIYDIALPMYDECGRKFTVAVIPEQVGRAGFMTWTQLRELKARGHGLVPHGMRDGYQNLSDYPTADAAREDWRWTVQRMFDEGLIESKTGWPYVYAQGRYGMTTAMQDRELIQMLIADGCTHARSTVGPQDFQRQTATDVAQRYTLPIIGHNWISEATESANISAIISGMSNSAASKGSWILMGHKIVTTTPTEGIQCIKANWQKMVDHATMLEQQGLTRNVLYRDILPA